MNQKRKKTNYFLLAVIFCVTFGLLIFSVSSSNAGMITFDLASEFSGGTDPAGPKPWLRATFDDGGNTGIVTLTMDAVNLVNFEFVNKWYFNYDTSNFKLSPKNFAYSPISTGPAASIKISENEYKAAGDGYYDFVLDFPQKFQKRFGANEKVIYTITLAGITADTFDFLSYQKPNKKNPGPFPTAAHIGGIGPTGRFSGWITTPPPPTTIPEPSTIILLGSLLIGLGLVGVKMKRDI